MIRAFREMKRFDAVVEGRDFDSPREAANIALMHKVLEELDNAKQRVLDAGMPLDKLHKRSQLSALERISALVNPDANGFLPLNTLFDPLDNEEKSVGVHIGLGRIGGHQVVIIASDNRVLAGAWLPAHERKIFRAQDMAERLRIPLVWLLQCSGVKLTAQASVYAGPNSGGRIFERNAELLAKGIQIVVGVFGTNPAGGGYHAISPGVIFIHKDANMAVGGAAIMGGILNSQGQFDIETAIDMVFDLRRLQFEVPPGSAQLQRDVTGFVKGVYESEQELINAMRRYIHGLPRNHAANFQIYKPQAPYFQQSELDFLVPMDSRQTYEVEKVIARLADASEHLEFKADYGPEVYCGLVRVDGFPVGVIANRQGLMPVGYPSYAKSRVKSRSIGGKLYRQGLIKMAEFVTLCGRDSVPIIWLQDSNGIDVGDEAEGAEVLALGQTLIVSIANSGLPMMTIVLRKGQAASHYIMGGPQMTLNNVLTIGTPATEMCVMPGDTAAIAVYRASLLSTFQQRHELETVAGSKEKLAAIVDSMNKLVEQYKVESRPINCARKGFVDEIVPFEHLRSYMSAFISAVYQNPQRICPPHQMLLPRIIQDQIETA